MDLWSAIDDSHREFAPAASRAFFRHCEGCEAV
jgi:hypothetical protein